jgi:hypothetical protein
LPKCHWPTYPFKWDAVTEQVVGDDQANAMLERPYRKGYEIEI